MEIKSNINRKVKISMNVFNNFCWIIIDAFIEKLLKELTVFQILKFDHFHRKSLINAQK